MEKRFKELIEERFDPKNYIRFQPSAMADKAIIELLQKVREATIAEGEEILTNPNIPKSRMGALKTDRIKIKESKMEVILRKAKILKK